MLTCAMNTLIIFLNNIYISKIIKFSLYQTDKIPEYNNAPECKLKKKLFLKLFYYVLKIKNIKIPLHSSSKHYDYKGRITILLCIVSNTELSPLNV